MLQCFLTFSTTFLQLLIDLIKYRFVNRYVQYFVCNNESIILNFVWGRFSDGERERERRHFQNVLLILQLRTADLVLFTVLH